MSEQSNSVGEWPPKVWHGVIHPTTGDKLPPTRVNDTSSRSSLEDYTP